jgi:hypothetical protein
MVEREHCWKPFLTTIPIGHLKYVLRTERELNWLRISEVRDLDINSVETSSCTARGLVSKFVTATII